MSSGCFISERPQNKEDLGCISISLGESATDKVNTTNMEECVLYPPSPPNQPFLRQDVSLS